MKKHYMILPLALILCFMVGCQDKAAMAELEEFKTQAEVEEQNKELVLRFYEEVLKDGNLAIVDEIVSPNFIGHNPEYGFAPDREGLKQIIIEFPNFFPDSHLTIEDCVVEGDKVITRLTFRGTHQGEFLGIPATGKQVIMAGIDIHRIEGDKIVERWGLFDHLGMMMQLGMELKPKEGEK
jgi:steroid delta-isomerase-like uncharacterized protein